MTSNETTATRDKNFSHFLLLKQKLNPELSQLILKEAKHLFKSLPYFRCIFIHIANPIPLAISVAKKGIEAKPTNSILIISLSLETNLSVTSGRVPLLKGIAHKT